MGSEYSERGAGGPVRRGRLHSRGGTPYDRQAQTRALEEIQPLAIEPSAGADSAQNAGWTDTLRSLAATPFKVAGMFSNRVRAARPPPAQPHLDARVPFAQR